MIIPKVWGFEDVAHNGEYCFKRMFINEGFRCSIHKHEVKDEVLMVGPEGFVYFETGTEPDQLTGVWMQEHERIRITPGLWHRFTGMKNSFIYESSTHHEDSDSIRWTKGGKVDTQEMKGLFSSFYKDNQRTAILKINEARLVADGLHRENRIIGMCNGCFDLLHPGHLALLSQAKDRCEFLFVACNSDRAIKQMKGPSRPFVPEAGRLAMLAATKFVDYVVYVDNVTCVEAVDAIKPNVYVTTAEHAAGAVPEAIEASKLGGVVEVISMIEGFNTTKISAKIKKS